jgi:tetratricopeptide (TPR) repeat protein
MNDSVDALIAEARAHAIRGEFDRAVWILERALEAGCDDVRLLVALGSAYGFVSRIDRSLTVLRLAQSKAPDDPAVQRELALTLISNGDVPEALQLAEAAHAKLSDERSARICILAQIEAGKLDLALAHAEALLTRDKANHDFRVLRARVLNRMGWLQEAATECADVIDQNPDHFGALVGYAEACRGLYRLDELKRAATKAHELDPESPEANLWLARACCADGDSSREQQFLLRALEANPRAWEALADLGRNALSAGDLDNAERALRQAVEIAPWSGRAQGELATFLIATKRGTVNLDVLAQDAERSPALGLPYFLAGVFAHENDLDRAVHFARLAAKHGPEVIDYQMRLGEVLMMTSNWAEARDAFKVVTKLQPGHGPAWESFAGAALNYGDAEIAAGAFEHATALRPNSARAWKGLGMSLSREGKHSEALQALERAQQLDTRDIGTLLALARTALHAGQRDRAASLINELETQLPPDHSELKELATLARS